MSKPLLVEVSGQAAPNLTHEGERRIHLLSDAFFQLVAANDPSIVRGAGSEDVARRTVVARHCDTAAGLFFRYEHGDCICSTEGE